MTDVGRSRREVLQGAGAVGLTAMLSGLISQSVFAQAVAAPDAGVPFSPDVVRKMAEELATAEFLRPVVDAPAPFDALNAEQYRDIRFRPEEGIWRADKLDQEVQLLPYGWIYNIPVGIAVVQDGKAHDLVSNGRLFSLGKSLENPPPEAPYAFSGFKIFAPLNRADQLEAYAVFQGASYFRAAGRGQWFGLAARGLAINTAQQTGEEFPFFRRFWIEKPKGAGQPVVVHALLDSVSVAGAYRFVLSAGESTEIDVDATLFPRKALNHVGLAPLTSMFLHGPASRRASNDVRPAVHDSEGLAIINGKGERLWRPLTNPKKLQTSAFMDANPKGFGLCQRDREFATFDDLDSRFERRPTAWIEPKGAWGAGYIELIEIPAEEQIHDNIVAYWQPAKPLEPGTPYTFGYRISWGRDVPVAWSPAKVRQTRVGSIKRDDVEHRVFVIDFDGPALADLKEMPRAELAVSAGTVGRLSVARHPEIAGIRVSFELTTGNEETIELRLALKQSDQIMSESWLFRWTQ